MPVEAELAARIEAAYDLITARELDAAEQVLMQAERDAQAQSFIRQLVRAIYWLSYIASLRGEHFLAEQRLGQALVLAEAQDSDALIAGIHSAVGRLHFMRGRIDDAEQALGRSLAYAHNSQDMRREAECYGLQGACRRSLGYIDDAYEYFKAAAVLWRTLPTEEAALTEALLDTSSMAFELGLDDAAANAFAEAQSVDSGPTHERLMARGYLQQAMHHLVLDDAPSTAVLLAEAQRLAGGELDYEQRLEQALAQGRYCAAVARYADALAHFAQATRLAQNMQSRCRLAEIRLEHARALVACGQLEEALAVLSDAEVAFEMFDAKPRLAQAYCVWTLYRMAEGRPDAARAAFRRAQELAGLLGRTPGRTLAAELHNAARVLTAK